MGPHWMGNATNGFHPLWLTMLLPFTKLDDSAFPHKATTRSAPISLDSSRALSQDKSESLRGLRVSQLVNMHMRG